jgi:hypothetical protein
MMLADGGFAQERGWRDSVENRLGALDGGLRHTSREVGDLRDEVRAFADKLDRMGERMSQDMALQNGALRADLKGELAATRAAAEARAESAAAAPVAVDWKVVALAAALCAGGLVGIGIAVGKAWDADDTRAAVAGMTP